MMVRVLACQNISAIRVSHPLLNFCISENFCWKLCFPLSAILNRLCIFIVQLTFFLNNTGLITVFVTGDKKAADQRRINKLGI